MDICWVITTGRTGIREQAKLLAEELDITLVKSRPIDYETEQEYIVGSCGVVYPTKTLRRTLLDLEPDIAVFHEMNAVPRATLSEVAPYMVTVVRLGINLQVQMLGSRFQSVPEVVSCLNKCDHIIASGPGTKSQVRSLGVEMRKISEIPSAVRVDEVKRPQEDVPHSVGTIGRIDRTKNQFLTVQAAKGVEVLGGDTPNIILAGRENGGLLDMIRDTVGEMGVGRKVRYFGHLDSPMEEFYPQVGVHVHPSWSENSPQTVLEAAKSGVPTIAPELGWTHGFEPEHKEFSPGRVIPTNWLDDPMAWSEEIKMLLEDDEYRIKVVEEQQKMLETHNLKNVTEMYEQLFQELGEQISEFKIPAEVAP